MAYIKKIWVDVPDPSNPPSIPEGQDALARFDAENMNRIEDGIENAVKKTGGTIEGDLQIYTNSPSLILNNKNQNHSSIYKNASSDQNIDYGTVIRDSAENIESGNYLAIILRHGFAKDGNLSDAFKLHLRNDGVEHGYKIYGEHNIKEYTLQTAIASYVGTGTWGADNPCSLTFDFAPKIIKFMACEWTKTSGELNQRGYMIHESSFSYETIFDVIACESLPTEFNKMFYTGLKDNASGGDRGCLGKKSADGKTISWYCTDSANAQFNTSGYTYYFLAIG